MSDDGERVDEVSAGGNWKGDGDERFCGDGVKMWTRGEGYELT